MFDCVPVPYGLQLYLVLGLTQKTRLELLRKELHILMQVLLQKRRLQADQRLQLGQPHVGVPMRQDPDRHSRRTGGLWLRAGVSGSARWSCICWNRLGIHHLHQGVLLGQSKLWDFLCLLLVDINSHKCSCGLLWTFITWLLWRLICVSEVNIDSIFLAWPTGLIFINEKNYPIFVARLWVFPLGWGVMRTAAIAFENSAAFEEFLVVLMDKMDDHFFGIILWWLVENVLLLGAPPAPLQAPGHVVLEPAHAHFAGLHSFPGVNPLTCF